jgi:5-methylcytosine-specific restriction protein A
MPAAGPKRLNWEWEELVLACDLVIQNNKRYVDDRDPRAIELSHLLGQMKLHPQEDRLPDFRNPNGVAQKTRNLVQHLPGYTGSASRGSKKDREVVERFVAEPKAMHDLADAIRAAVAAGDPLPPRSPDQPEQVVSLKDITRPAVLKAIEEYDELGQDAFLTKHGFGLARSYFLISNGKTYDSKAIVGVAHGYLPGRQPLSAAEFSGGEATVARLLRRLGFNVRVGAGVTTDDLTRLVSTLHVRWADNQPALYQPITLLWAIGRAFRGAPRIETWEVTKLQVGELLDRFGFRGERPRPDYPIAALFNAGLWELETGGDPIPTAHGDAQLKRWFDTRAPAGGLPTAAYDLLRTSAATRVAVVRTILETYFQGTDYVELLEDAGLTDTAIAAQTDETDDKAIGQSPLEDAYRRLCGLAEQSSQRNEGKRVSRTSMEPIRSAAARRAILLRSNGNCENPACIGHPDVLTDAGDPILEIDHIHDLAKNGPDNPIQMIALCPNCHAVKTRGRDREQLRQRLFEVARQRHQGLI